MSRKDKAQSILGKDNKARHNSAEAKEDTQAQKENIVSIPQEEYDSLKKEARKATENWDRLLRAQAEFDNIRKRLQKERQDFIRFANEDLVADLLMVLDDLERTVSLSQQNKEDFSAFLKGIELILGHLYEILKKRGLSPIETEGKVFDPQLHEALLHVQTDEVDEHAIVEELQKGYLLNGRVIRTAKVKISKRKSTPEGDEHKQHEKKA